MFVLSHASCADPERGEGSGPPENHKNIGFSSNTGPDSVEKIAKLLS